MTGPNLGLPKSSLGEHKLAISPFITRLMWCSSNGRPRLRRRTHNHHVINALSSSCDVYRHIVVLSHRILANLLVSLCSPNEDFGRLNKPFGPCFKSTFHIREYSIWATDHWKVQLWLKCLGNSWKGRFVQNGGELPTAVWNTGPKCLFSHPKSSFGERKVVTSSFIENAEWNGDHHIFK